MTAAPYEFLDANELLVLGLKASASGDSASAVAHFKLGVAKSPSNARLHWALGAEFAALTMNERAAGHFEKALNLEPEQPVCRFQFGLLLLTCGDLAGAESVWQPLEHLPKNDPVRLFKEALLLLARDEFDSARSALRSALGQPVVDPALRRDMEMLIGCIDLQGQSPRGALGAGQPQRRLEGSQPSITSHLALSAYRSSGPGGSR